MTRLIIVRHGNTFEKDETPRRIGVTTDMPLTEQGYAQARAIGRYLKDNDMLPHAVFSSKLRRARATARVAIIEAGLALHIQKDSMFNEIDYGPDENKTEEEVVARIGRQAIKDWDENNIPPPGWNVQPQSIISGWQSFGNRIVRDYPGCTVVVVTSNGIARFAPHLTGDFPTFKAAHDSKLKTGALGILSHDDAGWNVKNWNIRPEAIE